MQSGGGGCGLVTKLCPTLVTLWTVASQDPLSMGFSRQEYWSGLPFPPPRNLPNPGIKPRSPALQADSLLTELQGKPHHAKCQTGSQAGIKIAGRNSNNHGYADDTTLMAKRKEELKNLFMSVKEESEKAGLKLIKKLRSQHLVPLFYGK